MDIKKALEIAPHIEQYGASVVRAVADYKSANARAQACECEFAEYERLENRAWKEYKRAIAQAENDLRMAIE